MLIDLLSNRLKFLLFIIIIET